MNGDYAPVISLRTAGTRKTTARTMRETTAMMPLFLMMALFMGGSRPENGPASLLLWRGVQPWVPTIPITALTPAHCRQVNHL